MLGLALEFVASLAHIGDITRRSYRRKLSMVCRGWSSLGCAEMGHVTESLVLEWVHVRVRKVSWREVCGEMHLVCRFFVWLVRNGHMLSDPVPEWLRERFRFTCCPSPVQGIGETLRFVEHVAGLAGMTRLRDMAMVEVLYGCGLRRCELVRLDLADWRGDELKVRGKFGAERVVPVGRMATEALRAYVDKERAAVLQRFDPRVTALFVGVYGKRLKPGTITEAFRTRLGKSTTAHRLRHACVTHMLRNGANIVVLRDLLGHQSISTTRIYTEVKVEDVRKNLEKFHPRG